MLNRVSASLVAALALMTVVVVVPASSSPSADSVTAAVVESSNQFGFDLYGALRPQPGNLFFSPFSVSTALTMTYAGASGITATEMAAVLHLDPSDEGIHSSYSTLLRGLEWNSGEDPYQLNIVNRLWAKRTAEFLDPFLRALSDGYDAGAEEVPFESDPNRAARTINAWVDKSTNGRIKSLVSPEMVDEDTRLILTNAIYFKGLWESPFESVGTKQEPFKSDAASTVTVPMMTRRSQYSIAGPPDLSILRIPYKDSDLAMLILLPDSTEGLARLETQLSVSQLDSWLAELKQEQVEVHLPRFRMEWQASLNETLIDLGMPTAFGGLADFSAMNGQQDIYLSLVSHKAFVDVTETGTEAAAATSAWGKTKGLHRDGGMAIFRADHPFIFLIRDEATGVILFLGRIVDPTASKA
jgi:serine protease inhibitor